jgi:hypothetical protein
MEPMPKNPSGSKRLQPETFGLYNRGQYQRVVQLTEKAIAQLDASHQPVTLTALAEATRAVDPEKRGLSARTILRNTDAATLFRQHSPAYQERQQKATRAKRKRARNQTNPEVRAQYRGLHVSDLVRMVEELKAHVAQMNAHETKLQAERDAAYRLRDEALKHNARQLAALTAMTKTSIPR